MSRCPVCEGAMEICPRCMETYRDGFLLRKISKLTDTIKIFWNAESKAIQCDCELNGKITSVQGQSILECLEAAYAIYLKEQTR